ALRTSWTTVSTRPARGSVSAREHAALGEVVPDVLAGEAPAARLEAVDEPDALERHAVEVLAVERAAHVDDPIAVPLEGVDVLAELGHASVAALGALGHRLEVGEARRAREDHREPGGQSGQRLLQRPALEGLQQGDGLARRRRRARVGGEPVQRRPAHRGERLLAVLHAPSWSLRPGRSPGLRYGWGAQLRAPHAA